MLKPLIIIPSRLAATRLPQKPLIKINNKTLIMHVYEKAIESQIGEVYVATCDKEIASEVRKNGGKFIMTDKKNNGLELYKRLLKSTKIYKGTLWLKNKKC